MTAIRLFLRALDFPALDTYKIENTESDQSLITWLEHTKIRLYAVDNRAPLHSTDTAMWHAALEQYLADVHCPVAWNNGNNRLSVLQWLLNHAVGLQYSDEGEGLNRTIGDAVASAPAPQDWVPPALAPFPDATSPATLASLRGVLNMLRIPVHEGDAITSEDLQRAAAVLDMQVLPAVAESDRCGGSVSPSAASVLAQIPLGFSTGDKDVDLAATVLRMLYIKDLRDLQSQIDAVLVTAQEATADPRTDVSAGRVGR